MFEWKRTNELYIRSAIYIVCIMFVKKCMISSLRYENNVCRNVVEMLSKCCRNVVEMYDVRYDMKRIIILII